MIAGRQLAKLEVITWLLAAEPVSVLKCISDIQ